MNALVVLHLFLQCTPLGGVLANQHWSLIHEGLHGRLPAWQAKALCALYGAPLHLLRKYHLRHHRLNRVHERIEDLPALAWYAQLLGGLYVLEVALCLLCWQGALILLVQAVLIKVWGPWYVAALVVRALLVSLMDYVYHCGGAIDRLQGHDLYVGRMAERYLLGMNLHGAHHRQPHLPARLLKVERYSDLTFSAAMRRQFSRTASTQR